MNFLRLSYESVATTSIIRVRQLLEPARELVFETAFYDPGAHWGCKKNEDAEPIAKRMLQPQHQAGKSDAKCNDSAADDEELPEDTHVFKR